MRALGVGLVLTVLFGLSACARGGAPAAQDAPTGPVSATAATTSPRATGSPTAEPSVTPTPDPNAPVPLIESLSGTKVQVLTAADPVPFPENLVLYFFVACYACDGGSTNLQRMYQSATRGLVVDVIRPPAIAEGERPFIAQSVDGMTWYAGMCTGFCGGMGNPVPGSTLRLLRSNDGGISWEGLGERPLYSWVIAIDAAGAVIQTWHPGATESDRGTWTYVRYPSGETLSPPSVDGNWWLVEHPNFGLSWLEYSENQWPSTGLVGLDGRRTTIVAPADARLEWRFERFLSDGDVLWGGLPPRQPTTHDYVARVSPGGTVREIFAWPSYDFRVLIQLSPTTFIGNALSTTDGNTWRILPNGQAAFQTVLIDLDQRTVSPILGLPPDPASPAQGGYSFPEVAIQSRVARVVVGPTDCLNVRRGATADSEILGCYRDSVLLRIRPSAEATPGWAAVLTPDGREGFASREFLEE